MAEPEQKPITQSREYELTFKVKLIVTGEDVELTRRQNRNFATTGFFAKDKNIAQIVAYNKALELIAKQDNVVDVSVKSSETTDTNFNIK
ncbi:MAG: hypothetical protein ACW98F_00040 [Candidatus Hodarchaeales archaeon]|jgi:hypothetical protein